MLELDFINVADGDAVLIVEHGEGRTFRMLVDTGHRDVDVWPGSLRHTAAEHLRELGIAHIDVLVVSHLHKDHFGDLSVLLREITFDHVYSGFFPERPGIQIPPGPPREKTVEGLIRCLNQWSADTQVMLDMGCQLHTVDDTMSLRLTDRLRAEIICPDREASAFQHGAWRDLLAGRPVAPNLLYWSSKYRNPGSLRVRLTYAGRAVELPADCYGAVWEEDARPCDILKVPHHGDRKALTETLVRRLHPGYAVISCEAEYIPRKDRPCRAGVELLERHGARVWFTDNFSAPWWAPQYHRSIHFAIHENGAITAPDNGRGGGRRDSMITSVLFDMGGTLEDIYVDDASRRASIEKLGEMLVSYGLDPGVDYEELKARVDAGWERYSVYRNIEDEELKPVRIWCDYILSDFNFPREKLAPHCEEIAHMWEITYFHRSLRPRVAEMLEGLKGMGLKLGIISNTAALYQVFDILKEYGIRDYFQDVTLSSVTGVRKPDPIIFEVAMRQLQSKPEECVYVGDTVSRDIIGSKRAGFTKAIQIGSQLTKEKDQGIHREFEPDYLVEDIYEVYPIVRSLMEEAKAER